MAARCLHLRLHTGGNGEMVRSNEMIEARPNVSPSQELPPQPAAGGDALRLRFRPHKRSLCWERFQGLNNIKVRQKQETLPKPDRYRSGAIRPFRCRISGKQQAARFSKTQTKP
jgi:hypothetical protein